MTLGSTRGFTMVEAIVSLALAGFIIVSIATLTGQWTRSWNRGSGSLQRSELLAVGLDRLVADIGAARPVEVPGDKRARLFNGEENQLVLVRDQVGPFAGSALELIRFSEQRADGQMSLVRSRAVMPTQGVTLDRVQWKDDVVLVRGPVRVVFGYEDDDRHRVPRWAGKPVLPHAVSIDLFEGDTGPLPGSTVATLRTTVPGFCAGAESFQSCLRMQKGQETDKKQIDKKQAAGDSGEQTH